ncbi:hypothetical protein N9091_00600 [bacterium]|nr:hypothetical protein [bacterium]
MARNPDQLLEDNPKLAKVLMSIEETLGSHSLLLTSMDKRQADLARDQARRDANESVTDPEPDSTSGGSNPASTGAGAGAGAGADGDGDGSSSGGLMSNIGTFLAGGVAASGTKAMFKAIGKNMLKIGTAALIAPYVGKFIEGAVQRGLEDLNIDPELSTDVAEAVGDAGMFALIARTLNKKLALPAFFATLGVKIAQKIDSMDGEDDGVITAFDKEFNETHVIGLFGTIGTALGVATSVGVQKMSAKILAMFKNTPIVDPITDTTPGGGANNTRTPGTPSATPGRTGGPTLATNNGNTVPGFQQAGGTPAAGNASRLKEAMKKLSNIQLAKYAGVLKFAGMAASVGLSMVDVVDAIANDRGEEEVQKQLAGALGSVSGGLMGMGAGAALGFAIGGPVGSFIASLAMGTAGAIAGEELAEMIAEYVVTGESPALKMVTMAAVGGMSGNPGMMGNPGLIGPQMAQMYKQRDFKSVQSGEMSIEDFSNRYKMKSADLSKLKDHVANIKAGRQADTIANQPLIFRLEENTVPTKSDAINDFQNMMTGLNASSGASVSSVTPIVNSPTTNNVGGSSSSTIVMNGGGGSSLDNSIPLSQSN